MSKTTMTEFLAAAKPLMEYLRKTHHEHMNVIVNKDGATLCETMMHVPFEAEMKNFYFTFGMNHVKEDGSTLYFNYVKIPAVCEHDARAMMFQARGEKWAFSYPQEQWDQSREADKDTGFVSTEIPLHEVVIQWDKKEP